MKLLLKNILRYVTRNKFVYFAIFLLLIITMMVFGAFSNLSSKINSTYINLINKYNMHNIVINENWPQNEALAQTQKNEFLNELDKIGVSNRSFNSINITDSKNNNLYKIIEYLSTYEIDRLDIFENDGLPSNKNNEPTIPSSFDFASILQNASEDIASKTQPTLENIKARQQIVYFASKSNFNIAKFQEEFNDVWNLIEQSDFQYDPISSASINNSSANVARYLDVFLNVKNANYTPIIHRGNRLTFIMNSFNNGIPCSGYFEDPFSYVAVVSNYFLEHNNKGIYSFKEYQQDIANQNNSFNPIDLNDLSTYPNLKSTLAIQNLIDSIDDKYKIFIDSVPYLIVGTGVTPDFLYPVISFANSIPDPKKESLLYVNSNGYMRAETSFAAFPHEEFLLAKYNGPLSKNEILEKVNVLAKKYMSFPENVTAAYWYDDLNNQLTPTAMRVQFVKNIIDTFVGIALAISSLTIFLIIMAMALFSKNFIDKNKSTLAILISNGFNKSKIIWTISLFSSSLQIIAGPLGLICAFYLQQVIMFVLGNYWFLPLNMNFFNVTWFALIIFVPTLIFLVVNLIINSWMMRDNLLNLLKNNQTVKVNRLFLLISPLLNWIGTMNKYRVSIAFGSMGRIAINLVLLSMAITAVTFGLNTSNRLKDAWMIEQKTNSSKFSYDLFTPTIQGGQYFGLNQSEIGTLLVNREGVPINQREDYAKNDFLKNVYNSSPLFRKYQDLHWATINDSRNQSNNLNYMENLITSQTLTNYFFGLGNLGTNPWDYSKSLLPTNQIKRSNELTIELYKRNLTDMRPINMAWYQNDGSLPLMSSDLDKNADIFPTYWIIQNFGVSDPSQWELSYDPGITNVSPRSFGIINAAELVTGIDENGRPQYLWNNPSDVIAQSSSIADSLNKIYNSYTNQELTNNIYERLQVKDYGSDLFSQDAISNVQIIENGTKVIFEVDTSKNITDKLMSYRSVFIKKFLTRVLVDEENAQLVVNGELISDPWGLDNEYAYKINNSSIFQPLPLAFNANFINYITGIYNDLAYANFLYRINNNCITFDSQTDEQYAYLKGSLQGFEQNSDVKIVGIKENSKFINLYNNKNKLINNQIFDEELDQKVYNNETNLVYPVIINNYTAKLLNLNIGDEFNVEIFNHTRRYEYNDPSMALEALNPNFNYEIMQLLDNPKASFKVVNINNTGDGIQMYTNILYIQNILGLATEKDYIDQTNTTVIDNNNLSVGMNNQHNIGGFNGIFTSIENPISLSNSVNLYSPSGLWPGFDSFQESQDMLNLFINNLNPTNQTFKYLANALDITSQELENVISQWNDNIALARHILGIMTYKYDLYAFATISETINSLEQQGTMLLTLNQTINEILLLSTILIAFIALTIMILTAIMALNDLMKITVILKTLGYSDKNSAKIFFSIFAPSILGAWVASIPLILFANWFLEFFVFQTLNLFITIPFGFPSYLVMIGLSSLIYIAIFFFGLHYFKANRISELIKW